MAHMVESMFSVREVPWHKLGVVLTENPANVGEALKAAGLDWTVSLMQLQLPNGTAVDSYAAVRDSDGAVLGHGLAKNYAVMQNQAGFAFFDPFVASGAARIETAGSLRGGARVWMLARIDRPDSVIVKKADDRVAKFLLLAMGHDGHMSIMVGETPIRVVCNNTLTAALNGRGGLLNIRHTSRAADTLKLVQETIERADQDFEKAAEVFRALARKRVTVERLRAYIDATFPQKKIAKDIAEKQAQAAAAQTDAGAGDLLDLLNKPRAKTSKLEDDLAQASLEREAEERKTRPVVDGIVEIFEKGGRFGDLNLPGVKGTAWAAYNAVTEYLTWERGRSDDARLNSLWMGGANNTGARALQSAQDTFLKAA